MTIYWDQHIALGIRLALQEHVYKIARHINKYFCIVIVRHNEDTIEAFIHLILNFKKKKL